jgi:hypothetical protein
MHAWVWIGTTLAVLCCLWAFVRGGPIERYGAAIILVGWFLSLWLQRRGQDGPGFAVIAIDIVTLIAFAILSGWSRKLWTMLLTACQIDAVMSHFTSLQLAVGGWSYFTVLGIWGGYGLIISLALGVLSVEMDRRRQMPTGNT